jgi:hypothetical protein
MNKENRLVFKGSFDKKKYNDAFDELSNKESVKKSSKENRRKLSASAADDISGSKKKDTTKKTRKTADDLFDEVEKDQMNSKKYLDKMASGKERIDALKKMMGKDKKIDYQGMIYLKKSGNIYYKFKGPKYYPVEKKLNALRDYHLAMANPQTVDKEKAKKIAKQLSE